MKLHITCVKTWCGSHDDKKKKLFFFGGIGQSLTQYLGFEA